MRPRPAPPIVAGALLLLLAACGTSPDQAVGPTRTPTATPTATPTSTLPAGVDQLITFTYSGGTVSGPRGRVKVKRGTVLRVVVTSDTADEVHLHGYDKLVEVAAGGTAELTVRASISGVFEVELEKRRVVLTRIQVQ